MLAVTDDVFNIHHVYMKTEDVLLSGGQRSDDESAEG